MIPQKKRVETIFRKIHEIKLKFKTCMYNFMFLLFLNEDF